MLLGFHATKGPETEVESSAVLTLDEVFATKQINGNAALQFSLNRLMDYETLALESLGKKDDEPSPKVGDD
jgi:hypothetical protein